MDETAQIETPQGQMKDPLDRFIAPALFLGAAVIYNAILAIINAHVMYVSQGTVIAAEGVIVLGAVAYLMTKLSWVRNCPEVLLFQLAMLIIFFGVTLLSEFLNIKAFRDIFLITVFFLLGTMTSQKNMIVTFRIITVIVFVFMLMEAYMTTIYAGIFNPASYYANTRGIEQLSEDDSGLFRNSLGFQGRFSFGIFDTHRLSSIFIEQVAMANFALVLAAYLTTMWKALNKFDRYFIFMTTVFILLTNNSRTASALCAFLFIGHFVFPLLPRRINFLYPIIVLSLVFAAFYNPFYGDSLEGDDLAGRLGYTTKLLAELKFEDIIGASSKAATDIWDSGYAYFIHAQSLLGLLVFWIFTAGVTLAGNNSAIRFSHANTLIVFVNLLIGMAVFSIKTAAPLWFLAGYVYTQNKLSKER